MLQHLYLIEAAGIKKEWSQLAMAICERHFGVGADGLLLLLPSKTADIGMTVFNADGSEAEACGNGLRSIVRYAFDRGLVSSNNDVILVETIAGLRKTKLSKAANNEVIIHVDMGKPEFDADKIPVSTLPGRGKIVDIILISEYPLTIDNKELLLSFVAMGNPHTVFFQQQPVSKFPLSDIGPMVEKHNIFPNRVNFEVARVINRRQIEARVWERGVGETLACGSGACAVAVIAQLLGYTDNPVSIKLPGGTLEVDWDREGEVMLSGPAEIVYSGQWPD